MRIALIGMSGSGKSLCASILARRGYRYFGCDDEIGRRLVDEGQIPDASMDSLGRWMGFPFQQDYRQREKDYLDLEYKVMDELLTDLESGLSDAPSSTVVVDTTGSVIYTGQSIMQRLRQQTVVVHLTLTSENRAKLCQAYVDRPRPVIWRQHYLKKAPESNEAALERCYHNLLEDRETRYRKYAHLEIQCPPNPGQVPDLDALLDRVASFLKNRRSPDAI